MIETISNWLNTTGLAILNDLFIFLVIMAVAWVIIKSFTQFLSRFFQKSDHLSQIMEKLLLSIASKVMWVIALMIALPEIGVDVTPLIAGLGAGTLVVGFAFQESLSNFAAGFMISFNRPFRLGDYIEAAGESGSVNDLTFMSTTLMTPDNKKVIIPNRLICASTIVNYSATGTRRVDLVIGISYSSNIGQAIDVINNILRAQEEIHDDPAPLIEVLELAESSVNLTVRFWLDTADYWDVYFRVNRLIKEGLEENGVELPFPQMDIYVRETPSEN